MDKISIAAEQLNCRSFQIWDEQWFLLTCGDYSAGHFNTMTVSWGSLGTIWNKPFAQVVVRPTRFTYECMERYETFTLCTFPKHFQKALSLLGAKSGRDGDKIAETNLTPVASRMVPAPSFEEAELVIECKRIYSSDMDAARFIDTSIHKHYPKKDYHRIYFGEVMAVSGTLEYIERRV